MSNGQHPDADNLVSLKARLNAISDITYAHTLEWQLEFVKHLFILNGFGLAAAATMVAGNGTHALHVLSSRAASAFGVGLVFALSLMLLRLLVNWDALRNSVVFVEILLRQAMQDDATFEKSMKHLQTPKCIQSGTFLLGFMSCLAFMFGLWCLGAPLRALLTQGI
ncbi:hypothetical protein CBA19CS22_39645 [Caballeronia novacaledonica]|uniref:Uncharacterized protein n=1 Tax=Caballeronia novacaledonica TaxID=1544861 RepID=A0ACB5R6Q0_9BURK|nr:hypothetical protein CBA19CS22_39645 [Caballeronia novacaledonica]